VGTETNWEYHHDDICLAVCSKRCENFIINQEMQSLKIIRNSQLNPKITNYELVIKNVIDLPMETP
jgi:hypothetical protein